MSRLIRTALALGLLGGLSLTVGCSFTTADTAADRGPAKGAAPVDRTFWVDPRSPAAWQTEQWRRAGRDADARLMERVAREPTAIWPAGEEPERMMRDAVTGAARGGRTALFVAYDIPHRDCGQHSAGGAPDADAYRRWIDRFAGAIGTTRAWVVLEPDAVAHLTDGCTPEEYHQERFDLLAGAVERLKRQPRTRVFLDAGNPAWIADPARLTGPLRRAGVDRADGFALNVSNFQTDTAAEDYGRRLSSLVGGKHFVIDSSRNGRGPLAGQGQVAWCNPPGRALGTRPTVRTGEPLLDAFLWVKRPGESDGPCRGGPAAGRWWPEYALELARNTGD